MDEKTFKERYKTLTIVELLDILDNPSNYQPLAVKVAKLEFDSRQLTPEQIGEAINEQESKRQEQLAKRQKIKNIETKVKSNIASIVETFHPIQKETPTAEKYIKFISLFLVLLFLYNLYNGFWFFRYMFIDDVRNWDSSMWFYILSFVFLPIAAILFWHKKKTGWTLTATFFTLTTVEMACMFLRSFNRKPSGIPVFDNLSSTQPILFLLYSVLFGGTLYLICKENIRAIFKIEKDLMFVTIGIIGVLSLIIFL